MINDGLVLQIACLFVGFVLGYLKGKNAKLTLYIKDFIEARHNVTVDKID
jgi:hypothetical protein